MVLFNSIISQTERRFLYSEAKKCRIYTALGVSQTPNYIMNIGRERYYKNKFSMSELSQYGFSRELCGRRHMYFTTLHTGISLELVFILKNGKVISYDPTLIKPEGYKNLVEYICNETGIEPSEKLNGYFNNTPNFNLKYYK